MENEESLDNQLRKDAKKFREKNPIVIDLQTEAESGVTEEKVKKNLRKAYFDTINLLKEYCDLREDYYPIVSLWILGTYFHRYFTTYPYLFFNAMKGSGKTRILRLISNLAYGGKLLISMSEAVLFRTASKSCFCIDEFEAVGRFNEGALRELLNAAYKKGIYVERAKKIKNKDEEGYEIEKHELYAPIAMANIWGMENVLSDRCLTLTLEKSMNEAITMLVEDFEENELIKDIKDVVSAVSGFSLTKKNNLLRLWNKYIKKRKDTNNINSINYTNDTNDTYEDFFDKIANTSLNSRNLELFIP